MDRSKTGTNFFPRTIREAGWFGSMIGAGEFKKRLNNSPANVDAALNHCPIARSRQFKAFSIRYELERAGVATASRLLAMKRPDLFICIDSKSRSASQRPSACPRLRS